MLRCQAVYWQVLCPSQGLLQAAAATPCSPCNSTAAAVLRLLAPPPEELISFGAAALLSLVPGLPHLLACAAPARGISLHGLALICLLASCRHILGTPGPFSMPLLPVSSPGQPSVQHQHHVFQAAVLDQARVYSCIMRADSCFHLGATG